MGKRILFVDDELDVLKVATFRLKKAGYEITTALDGQAALELAKRGSFDLIFLDLRLPGMSGIEVCKVIKSDELIRNTPVILFTASLDNLEDRVKECGAQDYLIKPFDPEILLEKIKKFIN